MTEIKPVACDRVNSANVRCNACSRSLVGVTTANAGSDTQCKPHGFSCGLHGLKGPYPELVAMLRKLVGMLDSLQHGAHGNPCTICDATEEARALLARIEGPACTDGPCQEWMAASEQCAEELEALLPKETK